MWCDPLQGETVLWCDCMEGQSCGVTMGKDSPCGVTHCRERESCGVTAWRDSPVV